MIFFYNDRRFMKNDRSRFIRVYSSSSEKVNEAIAWRGVDDGGRYVKTMIDVFLI